jgi:putative transcriptional regulator
MMVALVVPLLLSMASPPIDARVGSVVVSSRSQASAAGTAPRLVGRGAALMPAERPAKGRLLVASRQLVEPIFAETVILLVEYGERGAMGVVLNRPTHIPLATALQGMNESKARKDMVLWGGPVAMTMVLAIVRATSQPSGSHAVFEDVYVTSSRKALRRALAYKGKDNRLRVFAGHAGWAAGQLEGEIGRGDWLIATADSSFVFDRAPESMWPELMQRLSGEWADRPAPAPDSLLSDVSGVLAPLP